MSLLESDVPIRNVITTDPETAAALDSDLRAKILDVVADEPHTVAEIREELARRGDEKAETTVRHHVSVLDDAGLIEIARLEDAGGGTRKYYAANTRVFSYDLPEGSDEVLAAAQATATDELDALVETLSERHGDAIEAVAADLTPCEYCDRQRYREFVVRKLLERALVDLSERDRFDESI